MHLYGQFPFFEGQKEENLFQHTTQQEEQRVHIHFPVSMLHFFVVVHDKRVVSLCHFFFFTRGNIDSVSYETFTTCVVLRYLHGEWEPFYHLPLVSLRIRPRRDRTKYAGPKKTECGKTTNGWKKNKKRRKETRSSAWLTLRDKGMKRVT